MSILSKIRLIAFDLDGTILSKKTGLVAPETIRVLEAAAAAGYHLCIATGRALSMVPDNVRRVKGLRYLICSNGAAVYDQLEGRYVLRDHIDQSLVLTAIELAERHGAAFHLYCRDGAVSEERSIACYKEAFAMPADENPAVLETFLQGVTRIQSARELLERADVGVEKFSCIQNGSREWHALAEELRALERLEVVYASNYEIELTNRQISKGSGLRYLKDRYHLDTAAVLAFGDGMNDLSVREQAGVFAAPADALAAVLAQADFITDLCDNAGVAQFLIQRLEIAGGLC